MDLHGKTNSIKDMLFFGFLIPAMEKQCAYIGNARPNSKTSILFGYSNTFAHRRLNENLLNIDWAEYILTPEYQNIQWNTF